MSWEFKNGKNQKCNLPCFNEKSLKIVKKKWKILKKQQFIFYIFSILELPQYLFKCSEFFIMIAFKITEFSKFGLLPIFSIKCGNLVETGRKCIFWNEYNSFFHEKSLKTIKKLKIWKMAIFKDFLWKNGKLYFWFFAYLKCDHISIFWFCPVCTR